jgi:hypothetical protein
MLQFDEEKMSEELHSRACDALSFAPDTVHIQVSVFDGIVYIQHQVDNPTAGRLNEDGGLHITSVDLSYLIAILQAHATNAARRGDSFGRYDIPQPANGDAFTKACDDTGGVG